MLSKCPSRVDRVSSGVSSGCRFRGFQLVPRTTPRRPHVWHRFTCVFACNINEVIWCQIVSNNNVWLPECILIYHLLTGFVSVMESFRARTLSGSGEDAFEIESAMELHERTHEHGNRLYYNNGDIFAGRFSQSAEDSDEHSVHKKTPKEFSYLYTYLSTVLFAVVLVVENIFHFRLFTNSHT